MSIDKDLDLRALERILEQIRLRTGMDFAARERRALERTLRTVGARHGYDSLVEMADAHEYGIAKSIEQELIESVSVNYTYFNREPQVLADFAAAALPELIATEGTIRIWSAACSSGEEVYSLAMLLAEVLGLELLATRVRILGTDINRRVIQQAEAGEYVPAAIVHAPDAWRQKYMASARGGNITVIPNIRRVCMFRRMNLNAERWPFSSTFNAVFCRNVLYYFGVVERESILNRIHSIVAPNGWFVTSLTEPIGNQRIAWSEVRPAIFRKRAQNGSRPV